MRLAGLRALVTGAASGLGRELASQLAAQGVDVLGVDVDESGLKALSGQVEQRGDRLSVSVLDVSQRPQVEALAQRQAELKRPVDVVINNAGVTHTFAGFGDTDDETIERVLAVNWWGAIHVTRSFLPQLQAAQQGALVNVASLAAFTTFPGQAIYSASKAALGSFSAALGQELQDHGVHVCTVYPGAIDTGILERAVGVTAKRLGQMRRLQKLGRGLPPRTAANRIITGITRGRSRICVGLDAVVLDGLARLCPVMTSALLRRVVRRAAPGLLDFALSPGGE